MKKFSIFLLIIALASGKAAQSQDTLRLFSHQKNQNTNNRAHNSNVRDSSGIQTLTGPGRNVGFYVGFRSEYSQIAGRNAFGAGGTLALIANHGLAFGLSGKGFITEPFELGSGTNTSYSYTGGYGGILIEPILFPKYPVHVSFPILLGAGGIATSTFINYKYPYEYTQVHVGNAEVYLIAEPGLDIEFNVTRWMRFALGATYRFTTVFSSSNFKSNPLNGFTGGFSLKFGRF